MKILAALKELFGLGVPLHRSDSTTFRADRSALRSEEHQVFADKALARGDMRFAAYMSRKAADYATAAEQLYREADRRR